MKKISFVLPVYNVEGYLEKCIRSIFDQDMPYKDYEIIVVNDGSPDKSRDIILMLQKELPNLLLIDQDNSGVSAARNNGLSNAQGEYVVFIDPDDYVNPNMLNRLYNKAKKYDLDILLSGRSIITPSGKISHLLGYQELEGQIFTGINAYYAKDKKYKVHSSSVGTLFRRSMLDAFHIKYPVGVIHLEDGVFMRKAFAVSERAGFDNVDFYQVFQRPGSASRSDRRNSIEAVQGDLISVKDLEKFKVEHDLSPEALGFMDGMIAKFTLLPLIRAIKTRNVYTFSKYTKILKANGLRKIETTRISRGYMLQNAKTYNISPWLFGIRHLWKINKRYFKKRIGIKNPKVIDIVYQMKPTVKD